MQFLACVHTVGFPKRGTQAPREASQNAQETVAVSRELRDPAFQLMCMIVYKVCLSTTHTHIHHRVLCLVEARRDHRYAGTSYQELGHYADGC